MKKTTADLVAAALYEVERATGETYTTIPEAIRDLYEDVTRIDRGLSTVIICTIPHFCVISRLFGSRRSVESYNGAGRRARTCV